MNWLPKTASGCLSLILVFTIGVRMIGIDGPLVFDDLHAVVFNESIRSFDHFASWFTDGQSFSSVKGIHAFRPLVLMSLATDYAIGGGASWFFKFSSILQHLVAVALVFATLRLLVARTGLNTRASDLAAFWGALAFAVHPLHVQTVNLASSRSEILALIGLLIALRGWLANPEDWRRRGAWVLAGTAFALGAKMTGVLVPAVVGLVELVLPADSGHRGRVLGTVRARVQSWLPLASAILVIVPWYVMRAAAMGTRINPEPSAGTNPLYAPGRDLATQLEASMFFVPKAFWIWLCPTEMTIDHTEFFQLGWSAWPPIGGALFLVLGLGFALWSWRRRPLVTLSVYGAFAFVLPWIVVRLNMPLSDHRMYPVVFFLGLAPAAFFARLLVADSVRTRRIAGVACVGIVAFLSVRSVMWANAWRDGRVLWETCLKDSPRSHFVWANLAKIEAASGDFLAAVRANEKAHSIYGPNRPILLALVESRLNTLRAAPRGEGFVTTTKRRLDDLVERRPDRWRGAMHQAEFAEVQNSWATRDGGGADVDLARIGVAWGLSMRDVGAPITRVYLRASRAARAARRYLEAAVLLEDGIARVPPEDRGGSDHRALVGDLCRVHAESGAYADARASIRLLRSLTGPNASFDAVVLEAEARLARAENRSRALRAILERMRRFGHSTFGLESPDESPKKATASPPN